MSRAALGLFAAAVAMFRFAVPGGEDLYVVAVVLAAGLVAGALGLLMMGHLLSEEWLRPVRDEAEAIARAAPFLAVLAAPIGVDLPRFAPWTAALGDLPPGRAAFLAPSFVLLRGALALAALVALAMSLVRTRRPRTMSAVGLFLLMPVMSVLAVDWLLFREPTWWSGLFPFAFAISQLLGALAICMAVSLTRAERAEPSEMESAERALLTLALLSTWAWFGQFLVVWYGDLPNEAVWYVRRASGAPFLAGAAALATLAAAVLCLVPPGAGRRTMLAGALLLVVHHLAHMLFLFRPGLDGLAIALVAASVVAAATVTTRAARTPAQRVSQGVRPGT